MLRMTVLLNMLHNHLGGVVSRDSVRCFSGFNFSQPTRRDRNDTRGPPGRTQQRRRGRDQDQWHPQQQQQQQQQQYDRQQYDQRQWSRSEDRQPRQQRQQQSHSSIIGNYAQQYLVTCHPGLEKVTAADLQRVLEQAGIPAEVEVTAPGRINMGCDSLAAGYAAALNLRSATRVLQLIHEQQLDPYLPAGQTVYEAAREAADWAELLQPQQTLGVHCLHFFNNSNVTHSQLVQRRVRDAVCDAVRDARGTRPAPPEGSPDLPLAFQMLNDNLQLYRDVGGGSLHRRGYRSDSAVHKAALNEAAAAGLMLMAGWQDTCRHKDVLCVDPMCGSGTLLIEAALIATSTAPGLLRDTRANPWPFFHWRDFQQQQWKQTVQAAKEAQFEGTAAWEGAGGHLLGNDCHAGALKLAQQAAAAAGVAKSITFHQGECRDWQFEKMDGPLLAVCNPPWGLRLLSGDSSHWEDQQQQEGRDRQQGRHSSSSSSMEPQHEEQSELLDAWQQLSYFLKRECADAEAWVLSGSPELSRHLGMRAGTKRSVRLGGQKTMWLQYNIRSRDYRPS